MNGSAVIYRVPELADFHMPDPPEPVLALGIGDDVIAHGRNGVDYTGFVKDTDPYQGLALVQINDPYCIGGKHIAWWEIRHLTKKEGDTAA